MPKFYLFIYFCCLGLFAKAQSLNGQIQLANGDPVVGASVWLKTVDYKQIIQYTFSDAQGYFHFQKLEPQKAQLIIRYLGYKSDTSHIEIVTNQITEKKIILSEISNILKEVVVSVPLAVQKKEDTTSYNVEKFAKVGDRTIEDVLKRLPGITVKEDGVIEFKGKEIKKLTLDGEDLTGSNYQKVTQNVKPEYIKEVKAIDHYLDEVLLKGIVSSEDVGINLTLKKPSILFGDISAAVGNRERYDGNLNLFSIQKKFKWVSFGSVSNVDQPLGSSTLGIDDMASFIDVRKNIDKSIYGVSLFDQRRFSIQQNLSLGNNLIIKPKENLKIELGLSTNWNQTWAQSLSMQQYFQPQQNIFITNQNQNSRYQSWYPFARINYLYKDKIRWQWSVQYLNSPQSSGDNALSTFNNNPSDSVFQRLQDQQGTWASLFKYTQRINPKNAIIVQAQWALGNINQQYSVNSPLYLNNPDFLSRMLNQQIYQNFSKGLLSFRWAKSSRKKHFWVYGAQFHQEKSILNAQLFRQNRSVVGGFSNKNYYQLFSNQAFVDYIFQSKKWRFNAGALLKNYTVRNSFNDTGVVILQPKLSVNYTINQFQDLQLIYNFSANPPSSNQFYNQNLLVDIRNVNAGFSNVYFFGKHSINLNYNFSPNAAFTSLNAQFSAAKSDRGFVNNSFFQNQVNYNTLVPYKGMSSINTILVMKQFVAPLWSQVKVEYFGNMYKYYGLVSSRFYTYLSNMQQLDLSLSSGFKFPINFTLGVKGQMQRQKNLDLSQMTQNISMKYYTGLRVLFSEELSGVASADFYDINRNKLTLIDFMFGYKPKKHRWEFEIRGNNLLNNRWIQRVYLNEFSNSSYSNLILGSYILLGFSYKFN